MSFSEWQNVTFGEVCETISETHKVKKGKLIFLNTGDIERGKILHKNYSPVEKMPGQAKKSIKKGDILFSEIRPANGRWAYVDFESEDFIVSTKLMVIRANEKINSRYLYHLLTSPEIVKKLQQLAEARSGTFPQITFTQLSNIEFSLPPRETQRKIASFFDSIERAIELLSSTNETIEEISQTIFRKMFNSNETNWNVGKLIDVVDITMGQSPSGKSFNQESKGIIFFQGKAEFGFRFPKVDKYTNEPKKYAKKFDTLLSVRAPVGTVNMANENCSIGRGLAAISGKENHYSFAYHLIKSLNNRFAIYNGEGTVFGSISKTDLEKLEINIPPKDLIKEFENKCRSLDELVHSNELEISAITSLQKSLLPKLLKGEIEIKEL